MLLGDDVLVSMVMCVVGVQQLEDQLDVGNIVVARNEAEIRVSILCVIVLTL